MDYFHSFHSRMDLKFNELSKYEKKFINELWIAEIGLEDMEAEEES